jgi:hypothetical protein
MHNLTHRIFMVWAGHPAQMVTVLLVAGCRQVTKKKTDFISAATFFVVTCDEVTTIDNGTWVSVHVHVVVEWERFHILVALEHVDEGATSNNLTKVIMKAVESVSCLSREQIGKKLMAFGAGMVPLILSHAWILS